jgi:ABC-type dipeptide/oligopeptide/nickel transport system permease subunit
MERGMGTAVVERLPTAAAADEPSRSLVFARRLVRTRFVATSIGVILVLVVCAIFAPSISPYDPVTQQDYANANQGPSAIHWLGTDYAGRDILSRLIHGSRISLLVGAISVGIGLIAGVAVGVAAGYVGGRTDAVLMRLTDVIWAFPSLMLALAITSALGRGIVNAMIAIGIVNVPLFARLARGSALSVRETDYVTAARALGVSSYWIMLRHVLPNIAAPVIVQASLAFGVAMTTEASLSFLGVGAEPPAPSWGLDLQVGYQYLTNNPSLAIFPGLAIFISVLAFNFLGDGLRTALDPRLR